MIECTCRLGDRAVPKTKTTDCAKHGRLARLHSVEEWEYGKWTETLAATIHDTKADARRELDWWIVQIANKE